MAKAVLGDNWMADYVAKASHGGWSGVNKPLTHLRRCASKNPPPVHTVFLAHPVRPFLVTAHHDLSL